MRRVLLLVLAVLLVLTGTCTAASERVSERVSEGVANDDYCDDGGDEWLTSACAGVPGAPPFQCHGSGTGALLQSVPASRVRDGVCDCCDGEDEAGSPFLPPGHCPQLCHQRRLQLKAETLAAYKHISAGLRAKTDLVNVLNRKKLREKQSYDGLLHEYTEIQKLYYQIKFWLERDSRVEASLMFGELRSRVRKCAGGFFEACDYFLDGSNTFYHQNSKEDLMYDFPELWDEQGPLPDKPPGAETEDDEGEGQSHDEGKSHIGNLDPSKIGNSPHRKKLESVSDKIEEVIRKNQARDRMHAHLNGPQRIENSFCAFEEMGTVGLLEGEESLRVHKNVKQYLEWLTGKGGRAARKLTVEQKRRKSTLFGAYLDTGVSGHEVGLQVIFEAVGLALAPLTVSYTQLTLFYNNAKKTLYRRAQTCVMEQSGDSDMFDVVSMRPGVNDDSSVEFLPCTSTLVWPYRAILELGQESSPLSIVMSYFDYNNYDWIMKNVMTYVTPFINSNMWYFRIIQQTPYYYYRYYFGDGASKLPVYRNACTLREGLRVAQIEAQDMREKIEAKKKQVEAEGGEVEAKVGADGRVISTGSSSGLLSSFQSSAAPAHVGPDFGPDGSWQALNGTCLTRHQGEYVYKVCAFQDVFQDRTKLGHFSHWGDKPLEGEEAKIPESKMQSFKNKIRNKNGKGSNIKAAITDLVTGSSNDEKKINPSNSYSKQYYGGGTACHNGIIRHAVVEFKCATFAEIIDIVEYEMCGYALVVNTPIACTREMEEAALRQLQQLDVYGYGSEAVNKTREQSTDAHEDNTTSPVTASTAPVKKSATVLSQEHKQQKQRAAQQEKAKLEESTKMETEVDAAAMPGEVNVVPVENVNKDEAEKQQASSQARRKGRRDPPAKQEVKKPYRVTFNGQ